MNDIFEVVKQIIILIPSIATIVAFWFLVIKSIADGVFANYPVKKKDIVDGVVIQGNTNNTLG